MKLSRLEAGIRIVLAFNEAFNRHDVAGMMQLMSDECLLEHSTPAPDGTVCQGKDAITQFWQTFFHESPHAHMEVEEIFGLGMRCVMRWRCEWVDAAGEKQHVRGVDIFQVKNGFISEKLTYSKG